MSTSPRPGALLRGLALALAALSGCAGDPGSPLPGPSLPTVEAAPSGRAFRPPLLVTLTCRSSQASCAELRYTLDGSEPTSASPAYTAPLALSASATLRFTGWDAGGRSASGLERYRADAEPPLASVTPEGGLFAADQLVQLHCSDGDGAGCAQLRYTLDGSAPGPGSPRYAAPLLVAEDTTLRFRAEDAVGNLSEEGTATYRFDRVGPVSAALPAGGAFRPPVEVALACTDVGRAGCATTHYTLDGSPPTPQSAVYQAPLALAETTTVRFLGVDALGNVGAATEERYLVDGAAPTTSLDPAPGLYADGVDLQLRCADGAGAGCAELRYTLDGSEPGPGSPGAVDAATVRLTGGTTIRFASLDRLGNLEATRSVRYEIDALAPTTTASPAGGAFAAPVDLVLSCDDGTGPAASGCAGIHYTVDGSAPTDASPLAAGPIHLADSATVTFFGQDALGHAERPHAVQVVVDTAPPRVVATSPRDGLTGLPLDTAPAVVFDEAIDPATLRLTATAAGLAVAGATSYDAATRTATFRPSVPLPSEAAVTVTLAAGLADPLGNAAAARSFTFATLGPQVVLPAAGGATLAASALAANAAGDAVVVFTSSTGTASTLLYCLKPAGGVWSAPATVAAGTASKVSVTSDGTGFLVVWTGSGGLVARTLRDGQLGPLESVGGSIAAAGPAPVVVSNGAGYAVAWTAALSGYNGSAWSTFSAVQVRLREGGAWLAATTLGTISEWADGPALASAGGGYLLAFRVGASTQGRTPTYTSIRTFTSQGIGAWTGLDAFIDAKSPVGRPALASDGSRYGLAFATARDVQLGLTSPPAPGANATFSLSPIEALTGVAQVALSGGAAGFGVAWQAVEGTEIVTRGAAQASGGWSAPAEVWRAAGTLLALRLCGGASGHLAVMSVKGADGAVLFRLASLTGAGWGPLETAGNPLMAASGAGFRLAWTEDDGVAALQLRSRTRDGTTAGPSEDVLPAPLPGSAMGLRLAANAAGALLAVWQGPYRGAQALFASLRRDGLFGTPEVVAFPVTTQASFAVASDGTTFAVASFRPAATPGLSWGDVVVRVRDETGFGPPELVSSTGLTFTILLASNGTSYAAVFDRDNTVQASVRDGGPWSPAVQLGAQGAALSLDQQIGAWPGAYEVGMSEWTPGAEVGRLRAVPGGGWSGSTVVLSPGDPGGAYYGPNVTQGPGGVLAAWYQAGRASVSLDLGSGYGPARTLDAPFCSSNDRLYPAPVGYGFAAVSACEALQAFAWDGAWRPLPTPPSRYATVTSFLGGPAGPALLFQDASFYGGVPRLEVSHLVDGAFQPAVTLSSGATSPHLVHDGRSFVAGWTAVDPVDTTVTRAVVQGGL